MRVLILARTDLFKVKGGDTVQILGVKEYLKTRKRKKIDIEVSTEEKPDIKSYDIVHLFNIFDIVDTYPRFEMVASSRKPLLVTTNYWDPMEYLYECSPAIFHRLCKKLMGKKLFFPVYKKYKQKSFRDRKEWNLQRKVLDYAKLIISNSQMEKEFVSRNFMLSGKKMIVIPNAVEADIFLNGKPENFISRHRMRDFVLCVGRIEERKNQLNLIRAMRGIQSKLVIIGEAPVHQIDYLNTCIRESKKGGNVIFLGGMNREDLADAFAAAKVHVLPSWWENTGLVSLEAALSGCNIVTTDRCPGKEYFGTFAWYCNPGNLSSIRVAVLNALQSPREERLKNFILSNFTWEKVGEKLIQAYKLAV